MLSLRLWLALSVLGNVSLSAQELADSGTVEAPAVAPYRNRLIGLPFVSYSPQTKVMFGVAGGYQFKWPGAGSDSLTRASYLAASAAYTTKGQWSGFVGAGLYTPGSRWWHSGFVSAGYFPVFYFGIGPRTTTADTNLMSSRFIRIEGRSLKRLGREFFLGPAFRVASTFDLTWQFPSRIPSGLSGGTGGTSVGAGLTAVVEGRNSVVTPTRGHFAELDYLLHSGVLGSDFDYSRLAADLRLYLPFRRNEDVLALAGYAEFNSREVPIQQMAAIGNVTSQTLMRGVYLGRFRDRHEVMLQADYRAHVVWRFGVVVYGAVGSTFGSAGNGALERLKVSRGLGLRFNVNPRDPLNLRVDYTRTNFGSAGLSLGAGEAF